MGGLKQLRGWIEAGLELMPHDALEGPPEPDAEASDRSANESDHAEESGAGSSHASPGASDSSSSSSSSSRSSSDDEVAPPLPPPEAPPPQPSLPSDFLA